MDKRGQAGSLFFVVLIAFVIFFFGMLIVNFIKTEVTNARTDVNCASPATDGTKALCLLFDGVIPYVFLTIISVVGGLIISRFAI